MKSIAFFIHRFIQRSFSVVGSLGIVGSFTCPTIYPTKPWRSWKLQRSWSVGRLFAILFVVGLTSSRAQNTWIQKADFAGTARKYAVGFSIGSNGYIGTGVDLNYNSKKDFWEYDPSTNAWTQKADFGGTARYGAVGFSLSSKGYIGTGVDDSGFKNDFWEYDPSTNGWIQKADFGGTAREYAVGFSIGSKGYIGTGYATNGYPKEFWEYDPSTNGWTQKADFAGAARAYATGFSIGNKGYIGTGNNTPSSEDFWEYDPAINAWTQKADFGGYGRSQATGFSIGSRGYIGTGFTLGIFDLNYYFDFWEYNPANNTWTQQALFGGSGRENAIGFSIGGKGYIGTGYSTDGSYDENNYYYNDFWEYSPAECIAPDGLFITNLTATGARLNWNATPGAEGYKVRHKIAGTSGWIIAQSIDNDKLIHGLVSNAEYEWQIKSVCELYPVVSSDWSQKQFFTTDGLRLEDVNEAAFVQKDSFGEIYPNPVSQSATVSFYLREASPVVIEIMDVNGRSLKKIIEGKFSEGSHEVIFSRENYPDHYGSLIPGIYFLQLKSNRGMMMKKVILE